MRQLLSTFGRWTLVLTALSAAAVTAGVASASAAWTSVAVWQMNEPAGADFMLDSSGHGRRGLIGDHVLTGVVVNANTGNKGYQWPAAPPGKDIERLVQVNRSAMNPFRNTFSVRFRLKTPATEGNIIQKGQATTPGGMWKVELSEGRAVCTFKGSAGRGAIGSRHTVATDTWHTVQCIRRTRRVTIIVDGEFPRNTWHRTGLIDNAAPLTIGGKKECNPPAVSCEYYVGLLDRADIAKK
jgi:Laminin G domain